MKLMLKIKYAPTPIEKFITAAIKFEHCSNQWLQEFTLVHWKKKKKKVCKILHYNNIALEAKMPHKSERQQKTKLHHV